MAADDIGSEKRMTTTASTSLPEEIIFEILMRLPPKSLVRFRHVSKFFRSLIVDPLFLDVYRDRSLTRPARTSILLCFQSQTPHGASSFYTIHQIQGNQGKLHADRVRFSPRFQESYLDSSANALICLSNNNGGFAVSNLSTGQNIWLPTTPLFSTSLECARSGMGFDSVSKTYKVLTSKCNFAEMKYWVYTLGVDTSWRLVKRFPNYFPRRSPCTSVHIDGVIYDIHRINRNCFIDAFDVRIEDFSGKIPFPRGVYLDPYDCSLAEVNGRIAIIHINQEMIKSIDVWTYEETRKWENHTHPVPLGEGETICRASFLRAGLIMILVEKSSNSFSVLFNEFERQVWRRNEICGLKFPTMVGVHSMVEITEELHFLS